MLKTVVSEELYNYSLSIGAKEDPVLIKLREYTQAQPNAQMQITPDQGQFMALMAQLMQAKKYLEIGVFTGYSSLCVTRGMGLDATTYGLDISEESVAVARKYWSLAGVDQQIITYIDDAKKSLHKLLDEGHAESFDLAFIDANKSDYPVYFDLVYKLLRQGGLIMIDNIYMSGRVLDKNAPHHVKAVDEFNRMIMNDNRVTISVVPIADGLTLAYKK